MASVSFDRHRGTWRVQWLDAAQNRRRSRRFATEGEAGEFADTLPPPAPRGGGVGSDGRGRRPRTRAEVIDLLAANFTVDGNGCWLWTGKLTNADYGRLNWKPSGVLIPGAHRVVLHAIGQPVPDGMVVDHLCRVRHCINPDHLDVVTQRENVMRSPIAPGGVNARKTHCANGHPYSEENTYTYTFKTRATTVRVCRTCRAAYRRAAREAVTA